MNFMLYKFSIFSILIITFLHISAIYGQDEEEEDEDIYDEELSEKEPTSETTTETPPTTKRYTYMYKKPVLTTGKPRRRYRVRPSRTSTVPPAPGRSDTVIDSTPDPTPLKEEEIVSTLASIPVVSVTAVAATAPPTAPPTIRVRVTRPPLPPQRAPATASAPRATTPSDSEEEEAIEEEGYGYIFRPLNKLIDNVVQGNVSGIVDNALSIRTPPEIRSFVNNVMSNVFGAGIGSALRNFMPNIFSNSRGSSTLSSIPIEPEPIPTAQPILKSHTEVPAQIVRVVQAPPQKAEKHGTAATAAIVVNAKPAVTGVNNTNDNNTAKKPAAGSYPLQLKFTHPGAPTSRLRCEVIAD